MSDRPAPDAPEEKGAKPEDEATTRQAGTDLINRSEFLLYRLQSELERLKSEADSHRDSTRHLRKEGGMDPQQILEEARARIEELRRAATSSRTKPPGDAPDGGREGDPT